MNHLFEERFDFTVTQVFNIVKKSASPDWTFRISTPNLMKRYSLAIALKGSAHYEYEGESNPVQAGDVLLFLKDTGRFGTTSNDDPWTYISVGFDIVSFDSDKPDPLMHIDWHTRSPAVSQLAILFNELNTIWLSKNTGYLLKARSLIMSILHTLITEQALKRYDRSHIQKIDKVMSTIQANYSQSYTLKELADLSGFSSSHFRLLFKQATGMNVIEYQNRIKIDRAKDFLLNGDFNVTEAAISCGFEDIYYFSRLFKKITGINPSDYMKKL